MKNDRKKYTDEEKLKVYFKSADQTANDRIEWFKKSITRTINNDIDHADLIQMEIEEIKSRLQKNKSSLEKAQFGNTEMNSFDPDLFEYLRQGLEPENSKWVFNPDSRYDRFLAVVDYKYLKKLEALVSNDTNEDESGSLRPVDWGYIDKRMKELIESGESMSAASDIVEKEIKSVRKAGSIRNWYGKQNQNWAN